MTEPAALPLGVVMLLHQRYWAFLGSTAPPKYFEMPGDGLGCTGNPLHCDLSVWCMCWPCSYCCLLPSSLYLVCHQCYPLSLSWHHHLCLWSHCMRSHLIWTETFDSRSQGPQLGHSLAHIHWHLQHWPFWWACASWFWIHLVSFASFWVLWCFQCIFIHNANDQPTLHKTLTGVTI